MRDLVSIWLLGCCLWCIAAWILLAWLSCLGLGRKEVVASCMRVIDRDCVVCVQHKAPVGQPTISRTWIEGPDSHLMVNES